MLNNVVYVLKIDGDRWYVGCQSRKKTFCKSNIIFQSGNPVTKAYRGKEISVEELKRRVKLIEFWEFDTKTEAEEFEALKIAEFKKLYANKCVNRSSGNMYGPLGVVHSEETKAKISKSLKESMQSEETRKKMSESKGVYGILQYSKDGTFITEFPSINEAERQTGVNKASICYCCKNKKRYKTAGGFIWQYKKAS